MSFEKEVPWPVWVVVTLLAAGIGAYATLHAGRESRVADQGSALRKSEVNTSSQYEGEIRRTIEGGILAPELAMRRLEGRALRDFFAGSALDAVHEGIRQEAEKRKKGIVLDRVSNDWDLNSLSVAEPPTYAEARVKAKFRNTYINVRNPREKVRPVEGTDYMIFHLRKKEGRWMIYSIEEDEEAEEADGANN